MTNPDNDRFVTNTQIDNVILLLKAAKEANELGRRGPRLAEASRQMTWALRRHVDECRHQQPPRPFRQIAEDIGLKHDVLHRQWNSGGPVVVAAPFYGTESRNVQDVARVAVAFRTLDDGKVHVLPESKVRGMDSFVLPFKPAGESPYSGRDLQYYHRPLDRPITELGRSAGYTLRTDDLRVAVSITEAVMDQLFGPPIIGSPERLAWEKELQTRRA